MAARKHGEGWRYGTGCAAACLNGRCAQSVRPQKDMMSVVAAPMLECASARAPWRGMRREQRARGANDKEEERPPMSAAICVQSPEWYEIGARRRHCRSRIFFVMSPPCVPREEVARRNKERCVMRLPRARYACCQPRAYARMFEVRGVEVAESAERGMRNDLVLGAACSAEMQHDRRLIVHRRSRRAGTASCAIQPIGVRACSVKEKERGRQKTGEVGE